MAWTFTEDVEAFAKHAEAVLAADPERHTLALTVVEQDRAGARTGTLYGWWADDEGRIRGFASQTPPYAVLADVLPEESMVPLIDALTQRTPRVAGVNAPVTVAVPLAAVAAQRCGAVPVLRHAIRLFRLEQLRPPMPPPVGRARLADEGDLELLVAWTRAFETETHTPPEADVEPKVRQRLGWDGYRLWCDGDGRPVSLAGSGLPAAGVSRIGPVYTPPADRGFGYAAGATWSIAGELLAAGHRVVLYVDLANPTSNALYRRLGFVPVTDRAWFSLEPRG
jgi:predicted GNAT family acetyltransferase